MGFVNTVSLIFLDGGRGHVAAVAPLLSEMGITTPVYGLVKDNKHHTRGVIAPNGEEISVTKNRAVFSLLTRLQDEVHRYTITYQTNKHRKASLEATLTSISGIGPKKAQALLTAFKTKESLKNASIEDISAVMKISFEKAREVKRVFIDEIR